MKILILASWLFHGLHLFDELYIRFVIFSSIFKKMCQFSEVITYNLLRDIFRFRLGTRYATCL